MDKQFSEFLCAVSETVRNYHDIIINCGNKEHGNFELLFFSLSPNPNVEKVCQWEGHLCQCLFSHTSQKAQLRAPLSPLQIAWTGFDPYSYSMWVILSRPRSGGNSCYLLYNKGRNRTHVCTSSPALYPGLLTSAMSLAV